MDGALQATAVLGRGQRVGLPAPFAVAEVLFNRVGSNCYAHVRRESDENGLLRFDISLLEDSGNVLAELKGLTMRVLRPNATTGGQEPIFVRPTWKEQPLSLADAGHRVQVLEGHHFGSWLSRIRGSSLISILRNSATVCGPRVCSAK